MRVRVDGHWYSAPNVVTGRCILAIIGKSPEHYALFCSSHGTEWRVVNMDAHIWLSRGHDFRSKSLVAEQDYTRYSPIDTEETHELVRATRRAA